MKQIRWISGPQNISIGDFAKVNIPNGYRFAVAPGAHVILENANTPVPDDLIGVLADTAGTWYAVLEYNKSGYVKSADLAQIDSASVLKAVQKQLQNPDNGRGITSLTWQSQPAFDAQADSLAWAVQVSAGSTKTLNEGVALLGRHGVLEVTAVRPYPLAAAPALGQIVSKDISFQAGQGYSDYQNSDKVGEIGLAGLIAGNNDNRTTAGGTATWVYWVYGGLGVCVVIAGFMVLKSRKNSHRQHRPARATVSAPAAAQTVAAAAAAPAVAVAATGSAPVALTNVKLNGNGHSSNGNGTSPGRNGKFHRNRRKRVFNYPKFYTHVMKELSFHAYDASPSMANGKSRNGHSNGHTNGNGNGNGANGHATNGINGTNGSEADGGPVKSGIEELIATQKALIHEQKCLLEQQTRLIAEKRWLIEEQTAFLKGQAGMINDQQFPLKFE